MQKEVPNPVDKLPPATDTGANTFGCLVNGEVVTLHKPFGDLSPDFGCTYQLVYNSLSGYSFAFDGTDKKDGCHLKNVGFRLDSIKLHEINYQLNTARINYGKWGGVNILTDCASSSMFSYTTTPQVNGQVTITHFDQQKQIVSGTFWFDAVEIENGDTVHVSNGRFDMHYTE